MSIKTLTHEILIVWYRAPNIWSIGFIFFEMAHRKPLFAGIDQIFKIFQMYGTPTENTWPGITKLSEFKLTFPQFKPHGLESYNKNIDPVGIDLLAKMTQQDPCKRISAKQALHHPYFNDSHSGNPVDLTMEKNNQKVQILDSNYSNNKNSNSVKNFKKLKNIDSNEIPLKSKNIAYPAGFLSSLTFNWLYEIIKNRTEDNPFKLSSLAEISPEVQSKYI